MRQTPSPLIFSPDALAAPPLAHAQNSSSSSTGHVHHAAASSGSFNAVSASAGNNTVSMPFVRRHVTRRLKTAKQDCDKELQKVTNSITVYFEEKLKESEFEREAERELRGREREREREKTRDQDRDGQRGRELERERWRDSLATDSPEGLQEPFVLQPADLRHAFQRDDGSEGSSNDADTDRRSRRHSRQASQRTASTASSSPAPLRRELRAQGSMPPPPEPHVVSPRKSSGGPIAASASLSTAPPGGLVSRRLSRSIHIPARPAHSEVSSRSTSRSRSPMPPAQGGSFSEVLSQSHTSGSGGSGNHSPSANRRQSRILVDDPVDPLMAALYEIIGVATDVQDMSVAQLTTNPKACEGLVQRVQRIGRTWDEHPDWHGRNWYVQVLLAIASLSRVLEWWEAEKHFWNFNEDEDEQDEPLQFVTKPVDEEKALESQSTLREGPATAPGSTSGLLLATEEESKLRVSRTVSQGRRSRDEVPKELSESLEKKEEAMARGPYTAESARVLATERLRLQAETAQNRNIVVELSMDGDHFVWVNYAWGVVVGTEPDELPGTRISRLLLPADWNVFRDATSRLQEDDSHTVEVKFRLQVESQDRDDGRVLYQPFEGKGMLMIDRDDGHPSHTMWVIRPIGSPEEHREQTTVFLEPGEMGGELLVEEEEEGDKSFADRSTASPVMAFPFARPVNTQPIMCRICECDIPSWYFEKHNETCSEVHRLEAEILDCNESIGELRHTIRELLATMDRAASPTNPQEYRGMPILSPSTSPRANTSPLHMFRSHIVNKIQRIGFKNMQRRVFDALEDMLQLAAEVSIPALKEQEAKEPIERQRLLSPSSERKMTQIRNWRKPTPEDSALAQLVDDADRIMRQKIDNVVRMQNTIRYSEKVRQEWEERVLVSISSGVDEGDVSMVTEEDDESDYGGDGGASSTTSEYAFNGDETVAEPTPIASSSPVPSPDPTPTADSAEQSDPIPLLAPKPAPAPHSRQGMGSFNTRSSTPSSVSSPLALVPPIVASPSPPPPIDLNDTNLADPPFLSYPKSLQNLYAEKLINKPLPPPPPKDSPPIVPPAPASAPPEATYVSTDDMSVRTLKTQKSTASLTNVLEPRSTLTPPLSPLASAHDMMKKSRRQSAVLSPTLGTQSLAAAVVSPRIPAVAPAVSRTNPTSIKDFEIIKPISKGAFGSVFLAKKKQTGDYYAIKVLKKADMIAKNQVTNVKAERMILMTQAESPFVAKLFFTFQSKENLYLVMEYLNGGDCAALVKTLGCLSEEWTKNYVAEVVLGLESMHQRGIVHRDLKPDNLLIDQHGHLKLTDFGLSRIGLLGRQTRETSLRAPARLSPGSRPPSIDLAHLTSPLSSADAPQGGSYFSQRTHLLPRLGSSPYLNTAADDGAITPGESGGGGANSGTENLIGVRRAPSKQANESPLASFATELTTDLRSHSSGHHNASTPPAEQKFVGTPDYLAPETILGLRGDDAVVDWWALGVITYEFLYGIPPFHDETPGKVFENILSGRIEWHEDLIEYSDEARDFMQRLMTLDPASRLGAHGAEEVKAHPWFEGMDWENITTSEAVFVPQVTDAESTDYFDPRGAIPQLFQDDDLILSAHNSGDSPAQMSDLALPSTAASAPIISREHSASPGDDNNFGSFNFKNYGVLKQANDDVIRKLRTDQMTPINYAFADAPQSAHSRRRSISHRVKKPPSVVTSFDPKTMPNGPPSPTTSTSSVASSPSRASLPPSTPGSASGHARKPSEYSAVERFKSNHVEGEGMRRPNSTPSRLRTASVSTSSGDGSSSDWPQSVGAGSNQFEVNTPPSSVASVDLKKAPDPNDRAVTCLLAEDNPITSKIIETLLIRLGCRCVAVADGAEAVSVAMSDIKFDCILMDLHMPILDGERAARYIKTTNGKNSNTPIVAVSAYSGNEPHESNTLFSASLPKPVQKANLLEIFKRIGFKTQSAAGKAAATKVTAIPTTS